MTDQNHPDLGYDPGLGYDAGPAGGPMGEQDQLEPFYRELVAEQDYDPEERGKVIYAEFALGPDRGRTSGPSTS